MEYKSLFRMRPFTWVLAAIFTGLVGLYAMANFLLSSPVYRGQPSDHFDGKVFFNSYQPVHKRGGGFLKWMMTRKRGPWLAMADNAPLPAPSARVGDGELRITYVGHSTILIQMDGKNILVDPIWSDRASPFSFLGPKRHTRPGIRFEDLPPIDVVLISHSHYDHLDLPTIKALLKKGSPIFLTGLGNKKILTEAGATNVQELDWWGSADAGGGTKISFVPAIHFSARSSIDRDRTLWGGFVIEGKSGVVYFAGDTGMGKHFEEIRKRFGPPNFAFIPIGAYLPRWFMAPLHTSPEDAVKAHKILGAKTSVPIHFGTFSLGDDGQFEAINELFQVLARTGVSPREFRVLKPGESLSRP